jgi:hypothetical protein
MLPPCNGSSRRQSHTDRLIPTTGNSRDHNSFPTRVLKSGVTSVRQWRRHTHTVLVREDGFVCRPALSLPNLSGVGSAGFLFRYRTAVALHGHLRLRRVELPVALFDAASPLEAGNGCADMIRASSLACGGDFLLRLALCQSKHLITKGR